MPLNTKELSELEALELKALEAKAAGAEPRRVAQVTLPEDKPLPAPKVRVIQGAGEARELPPPETKVIQAAGQPRHGMGFQPVLVGNSGPVDHLKMARAVKDFMTTDTRPAPEVSAKEWAAAGPAERAQLLVRNFIHYSKQPVVDATNAGTNMALRAGLPAVGQAVGRMVSIPAADRALGAAGGAVGEFAAQVREGQGIRPGAIAGNALASMVRGASLANPSAARVATEAGKNVITNVASMATETAIDEQRKPTPGEMLAALGGAVTGTTASHIMDRGTNTIMRKVEVEKALQQSKRLTLKLGNELGYVVPPSLVNPSGANNFVNSVGGKAATMQEVVRRNQKITNAAVVEELGLPENTDLGFNQNGVSPALNAAKEGPFNVYGEVRKSSPQAEAALELFMDAQNKATRLRSAFNASYPKNLDVKAEADAAQVQANEAVKMLQDELKDAPELFSRFKEARRKLGKISLVEEALEGASGDVRADVIGRAWERSPETVTGKLATIGRFQNQFPQTVRLAELSPAPGVNQLMPMAGATVGAASGSPERAVLAMLAPTAIGQGARDLMLSRPYQAGFSQYTGGPSRPDIGALAARFAAQSASRQVNPQAFQQPMPPAPTPFLNRP